MGANHLSSAEMTADTGDPLLLVKRPGCCSFLMDPKRSVAFQAFFFRRTARGLLKYLAGEGPGMGRALPFSILLHMAGAALACLWPLMAFRVDPCQVAKGGAAGHEQHSEEGSDDWDLLKGKRVMTHW